MFTNQYYALLHDWVSQLGKVKLILSQRKKSRRSSHHDDNHLNCKLQPFSIGHVPDSAESEAVGEPPPAPLGQRQRQRQRRVHLLVDDLPLLQHLAPHQPAHAAHGRRRAGPRVLRLRPGGEPQVLRPHRHPPGRLPCSRIRIHKQSQYEMQNSTDFKSKLSL